MPLITFRNFMNYLIYPLIKNTLGALLGCANNVIYKRIVRKVGSRVKMPLFLFGCGATIAGESGGCK